MKTFFKHLKVHSLTIVLIIVFLFIQAMCDLSLPDYTSKIVDVGIQQSGIKDNVFKEIRKDEYKKIKLFLKEEEKQILDENYERKDDKYYLKDIDEKTKKTLSNILINPEMIILTIESNSEQTKMIFEKMNIKDKEEFYEIIKKQENDEIIKNLEKQFEKIDEKFKTQYGISYVKNEYKNCNVDIVNIQNKYIKQAGIKMLLISFIAVSITVLVSYLSSKLAARFASTLRKEVVEKVMSFGNREFKEIGTSSLITRSTNDISRVQMFLTMLLRIMIYAPLIGIGALLKVIGNSMNFIIIIAVSLILVLVIILFTVAIPKFKIVQELIDKVNLVFREILNGLPVIRAFANEKHEEERFDEANKKLKRINLFVDRVMTLMMPTMTFLMNFICVLIVWVGAKKIDMGTIQIGTLMAFIQYTMQIIMSFLMISMMSIMIPRAWISIKRIAEIFDKVPTIKDKEKTEKLKKNIKGIVEFKDVSFKYPDSEEYVLENISFKANPGTTTAIIGGTGSGKSTLINLIPRFFDATKGQILIDGINIKNLKLHDLREIMGLVPQKGVLFKGTIKSNIALGQNKIDNKKIIEAAQISQSEEFIENKPDKYEEMISQNGTNISGGQKQRLSIARAIYKKPSIYIFDDSFSALDFKTDKNLRTALKKITKKSTVFIVAQRISTVLNADQIIVLDDGKIVGIGTHEELMKNCEIYKEIALSQVTEEELKHGK